MPIIYLFLLLFLTIFSGCDHADTDKIAVAQEKNATVLEGEIGGFDTTLVSGHIFKTKFKDADTATKETDNFTFHKDGELTATFIASHPLLFKDIVCDLNGSWTVNEGRGWIETKGVLTCDDPSKNDTFDRDYELLETLNSALHFRQYNFQGEVELTIERLTSNEPDPEVSGNYFDSSYIINKQFRTSYVDGGRILQSDDFTFFEDGNIDGTSFIEVNNSVTRNCTISGSWNTASAEGTLHIDTDFSCDDSSDVIEFSYDYHLITPIEHGLVLSQIDENGDELIITIYETGNKFVEDYPQIDRALLSDKFFEVTFTEGAFDLSSRNFHFSNENALSGDFIINRDNQKVGRCTIATGGWSIDDEKNILEIKGDFECNEDDRYYLHQFYTLGDVNESITLITQSSDQTIEVQLKERTDIVVSDENESKVDDDRFNVDLIFGKKFDISLDEGFYTKSTKDLSFEANGSLSADIKVNWGFFEVTSCSLTEGQWSIAEDGRELELTGKVSDCDSIFVSDQDFHRYYRLINETQDGLNMIQRDTQDLEEAVFFKEVE